MAKQSVQQSVQQFSDNLKLIFGKQNTKSHISSSDFRDLISSMITKEAKNKSNTESTRANSANKVLASGRLEEGLDKKNALLNASMGKAQQSKKADKRTDEKIDVKVDEKSNLLSAQMARAKIPNSEFDNFSQTEEVNEDGSKFIPVFADPVVDLSSLSHAEYDDPVSSDPIGQSGVTGIVNIVNVGTSYDSAIALDDSKILQKEFKSGDIRDVKNVDAIQINGTLEDKLSDKILDTDEELVKIKEINERQIVWEKPSSIRQFDQLETSLMNQNSEDRNNKQGINLLPPSVFSEEDFSNPEDKSISVSDDTKKALLDSLGAATASSNSGKNTTATQPRIQLPINFHLTANQYEKWGRELNQNLIIMIGRKLEHVRMQLHPAHLGALDVSLNVDKNKNARLQFITSSDEAREAIRSNIKDLVRMFADQGLNLEQADVEQNEQKNSKAVKKSRLSFDSILDAEENKIEVEIDPIKTDLINTFA